MSLITCEAMQAERRSYELLGKFLTLAGNSPEEPV
ncbi:hypothetical protein IW256_003921 [Actinomadura viridis]|uniref:Uncharacterized protein n=1 Tax=Actinomadura viridis TaxID=58110 RepID=A0A931GJJ7_9ACTN|nr:hypothetical protein [Actinomadura viridis]